MATLTLGTLFAAHAIILVLAAAWPRRTALTVELRETGTFQAINVHAKLAITTKEPKRSVSSAITNVSHAQMRLSARLAIVLSSEA